MRAFALALIAVSAVAAPAHAMTNGEFLAKGHALKAKGFAAMWSSDVSLLSNAVVAAGKALRAEQDAAVAAHRPPATCMPKPAPFKGDEFLAYLERQPPVVLQQPLKSGLASFMNGKFPCR